MKIPIFGFLARHAKVIPIAGLNEDLRTLRSAFDAIGKALDEGHLVCIFPEGAITKDGEMGKFKKGIEKVLARNPVPVIPVGLKGMWGSFFSRRYGKAMSRPFGRVYSRVEVHAGLPVPAQEASGIRLHADVSALLSESRA